MEFVDVAKMCNFKYGIKFMVCEYIDEAINVAETLDRCSDGSPTYVAAQIKNVDTVRIHEAREILDGIASHYGFKEFKDGNKFVYEKNDIKCFLGVTMKKIGNPEPTLYLIFTKHGDQEELAFFTDQFLLDERDKK